MTELALHQHPTNIIKVKQYVKHHTLKQVVKDDYSGNL